MSSMRGVLLDVLVAFIILMVGGAVFSSIAGVGENEEAPGWVQIAPMFLAIGYIGWRTLARSRQRRAEEADGSAADAPERRQAIERIDAPPLDDYQWRSRLESLIRNLGSAGFEQFTLRILDALAMVNVQVVRVAADGGVECLGEHDDAERERVYAICRRSFGTLGANQVRGLRELMGEHQAEGLFITNGEFSASAIDEAERGDELIELVDGDELLDLMHTHRLGLIFDESGRVTGVDDQWFAGLDGERRLVDGGGR